MHLHWLIKKLKAWLLDFKKFGDLNPKPSATAAYDSSIPEQNACSLVCGTVSDVGVVGSDRDRYYCISFITII